MTRKEYKKIKMTDGIDKPFGNHQFKSKNGKYYNGYMLSPECVEELKKEFLKIDKKQEK